MSDWKEDANKRRDSRHVKEGPEETGPIKPKKPSPKKRERLTPIWEVRTRRHRFGDERFAYVSAETKEEAVAKGQAVLGVDTTHLDVLRLHQKDRETFGDVLDTTTTLTWHETMERWYPRIQK